MPCTHPDRHSVLDLGRFVVEGLAEVHQVEPALAKCGANGRLRRGLPRVQDQVEARAHLDASGCSHAAAELDGGGVKGGGTSALYPVRQTLDKLDKLMFGTGHAFPPQTFIRALMVIG